MNPLRGDTARNVQLVPTSGNDQGTTSAKKTKKGGKRKPQGPFGGATVRTKKHGLDALKKIAQQNGFDPDSDSDSKPSSPRGSLAEEDVLPVGSQPTPELAIEESPPPKNAARPPKDSPRAAAPVPLNSLGSGMRFPEGVELAPKKIETWGGRAGTRYVNADAFQQKQAELDRQLQAARQKRQALSQEEASPASLESASPATTQELPEYPTGTVSIRRPVEFAPPPPSISGTPPPTEEARGGASMEPAATHDSSTTPESESDDALFSQLSSRRKKATDRAAVSPDLFVRPSEDTSTTAATLLRTDTPDLTDAATATLEEVESPPLPLMDEDDPFLIAEAKVAGTGGGDDSPPNGPDRKILHIAAGAFFTLATLYVLYQAYQVWKGSRIVIEPPPPPIPTPIRGRR